MTGPSPARARGSFAGGDQSYLRTEQYADSSRLAQRATIHELYSTADQTLYDWLVPQMELEQGHVVLEVGCGAGWMWEKSEATTPEDLTITLTDLSAGMVDEATRRVVGTNRFAKVSGTPADCHALPFTDQSFHLVVANHMLYHLPDPATGVAELARVLRPGGLLMAATNGRAHMREMWQIRAQVFDLPAVDDTIDVFGADVGFPILRQHFDEVRWVRFEDSLQVTDPAAVLDYICSTPPGETASASERQALADAIAHRFAAENGTMTITKDVGVFLCGSVAA